ncbi:MAG: S-adenosylmethionine:tRNA ribosyltransferase-isomerase [Candidatus Kapabacteria bacterium]|nr:S-adenosylmethionine:tRNA ribosyltransferase-isomerase [Candidatus Kapabacteria bacterium]
MKEFFPNIFLEDYNYELPKERIALYPLPERSSSKLLVAGNKTLFTSLSLKREENFKDSDFLIFHKNFKDLPDLIPENSIIFINDTKVIPARLLFKKATGGLVEIFCLEPIFPSTDPLIALQSENKTIWKCLYSGRKVKEGTSFELKTDDLSTTVNAVVLNKEGKELVVEFSWKNEREKFINIINKIGNIPLPPYINRNSEENDYKTYQTVYANSDGSVASPTAGLHFTESIFDELAAKKVKIDKLTLHIGLGTFSPIETENIAEHNMHSEIFSVNLETLKSLYNFLINKGNKRLVAVGTTSLRTLETLYWMGIKIGKGRKFKNDFNDLVLNQYEPYFFQKTEDLPSPSQSIKSLIDYLENELKTNKLYGRTELFIVPGYEFKIVDTLITNFHLPGSTLILLVAAFVGKENFHKIYNEALENDYRFLSYGDSSLLFR